MSSNYRRKKTLKIQKIIKYSKIFSIKMEINKLFMAQIIIKIISPNSLNILFIRT